MHPRVKTLLTWAVILVIGLHFFLVFVFITPIKKPGGRLHYYAMYYVYPFFDQGWNLFAPAPRSNYHLYVSYRVGKEMKHVDLIQEIGQAHAVNRFGGHEVLSLALSNSIHIFEYGTALKKQINGPVKADINFTVVQHFVEAYVQQKSHGKAEAIKFFLLVQHVDTKQQWLYF